MATRDDREDVEAKKVLTAAELDELEERQARLAARQAQKQERLRAKFAREAAKANEEWENENRRWEEAEERERAEQALHDEVIVSRTQQQYQQMSRWQRAAASRSDAAKAKAKPAEVSKKKDDVPALPRVMQETSDLKGGTQVRTIIPYMPKASCLLPPQFAPVSERKVRILLLHGNPGNTNLIKFATTQLRSVIGNQNVEWLYLDAPYLWQPNPDPWRWSEMPRSEFEKRVANGQPFKAWFSMKKDGSFIDHEASCDYLEEHICEMDPIDAIAAFSQGASLVSMLIDRLRYREKAVPWRLNIFFNGGHIVHPSARFKESSPHPTILIPGGLKNDPYADGVDARNVHRSSGIGA